MGEQGRHEKDGLRLTTLDYWITQVDSQLEGQDGQACQVIMPTNLVM